MSEYTVKVDKEILEGIKKLELREPVIVLGPKLGSAESGKESTDLRVYAYGGLIGEIPTTNRLRDGSLGDKNYPKYLSDNSEKSELKRMLEECQNQTREQKLKMLFSEEYLTLIIKACKGRFSPKKERSIETELVKKYLINSDIWIPIDIEFSVPKEWLDEELKGGKPDIIIYDKRVNAFRFIELKCNNKCDSNSLWKHYQDAMKIVNSSYRSEIVNECFRKMGYLYEYGIISGEEWKAVLENTNRNEVQLQFGFFFVGGELNKYREDVEKQLSKTDKNCSFLYASKIDSDALKNCQMLTYDEFMENEYCER